MTLRIPALVLLLAVAAFAGDPETKLREAAAQLADGDPAVRAKGREGLSNLADEHPELVRGLAGDKDPEVAAAAKEVLFKKCILKDLVEAGRFEEILQSIADPAREPAARRELFGKYLDLGSKAVAILAAELAESKTESLMEWSTVKPGDLGDLDLRLKNTGGHGLWYAPELYLVRGACSLFSNRLCPARLGGRGGGSRNAQPDVVLDNLSRMRRVPAGQEFSLGKVDVASKRCGDVWATVYVTDSTCAWADFGGVRLTTWPPPLSQLPDGERLCLGAHPSPRFTAEIVPKGEHGRPALRITPLVDDNKLFWRVERLWWAAEGARGTRLGFALMRKEGEPAVWAWKKDEVKVVEMEEEPPPGTVRLWLGYDGEGDEQVVPVPLELPGKPDPPK